MSVAVRVQGPQKFQNLKIISEVRMGVHSPLQKKSFKSELKTNCLVFSKMNNLIPPLKYTRLFLN